jgi:cysteine-rich repeat protein
MCAGNAMLMLLSLAALFSVTTCDSTFEERSILDIKCSEFPGGRLSYKQCLQHQKNFWMKTEKVYLESYKDIALTECSLKVEQCANELGLNNSSTISWTKSSKCGDRDLNIDEECDDGNRRNGDGCSSVCTVECGWSCSGDFVNICDPTCAAGTYNYQDLTGEACCGNGLKTASEQCDDGNLVDGDGCSSACTVEVGWNCSQLHCKQSECKEYPKQILGNLNSADPEKLPEPLSTPLPEKLPEPLSTPLPEKLPEPLSTPLPEKLPEPLSTPLPEKLPEPLPSIFGFNTGSVIFSGIVCMLIIGLVCAAIAFRCGHRSGQLTSNTKTPAAVPAPKSAAVSAPKSAAVSAREPIDRTKKLNRTQQEEDDMVARMLTEHYAKQGIVFPCVKAKLCVI